jgi:2'-hydroxyisoflavone reductase
MKTILLLGGTNFIGRNLVEQLRSDENYRLTLLNRGKTNPALFPDVEQIREDRDQDYLRYLLNRKWDIIIDFSCYLPRTLKSVLRSLSSHPEHYVFVSSCSVYENIPTVMKQETSSLLREKEGEDDDDSLASYGLHKARCEAILRNSGIRYTILRPALVYGPHDPTDRLYYWIHQVNTYREIIVPDAGQSKFSLTYAGDLVNLIHHLIARPAANSAYNAISHSQVSIRQLLDVCAKIMGKNPEIISAPPGAFFERGLEDWSDIPLWLDDDHRTYANEKMRKDFPEVLPDFEESLRATINYYDLKQWPIPQYGIDREQQLKIIEATQQSSPSKSTRGQNIQG